jgi:hypothetical protein
VINYLSLENYVSIFIAKFNNKHLPELKFTYASVIPHLHTSTPKTNIHTSRKEYIYRVGPPSAEYGVQYRVYRPRNASDAMLARPTIKFRCKLAVTCRCNHSSFKFLAACFEFQFSSSVAVVSPLSRIRLHRSKVFRVC